MGEVGIVGTLFSTLILSEAEAFACEMSQLLLQFPIRSLSFLRSRLVSTEMMRVLGSGVAFRIPLCTVICRRCRTYKGKANEEYPCLQKGWDVKSVIIFSSSFLFHKPRFTVFPSYQAISRTVVIQTVGLYSPGSA